MRLEDIRTQHPAAVVIAWRAFLLRPQPREMSRERFRRYTESWRQPACQQGGRFRVWSTNDDPPSHSIPPAVAVKAAARQGRFSPYHLAVMDAYFWRNRNVTVRATLVDVARACGLDIARFERDLDDPVLLAAVAGDHEQALAKGISAVPTVVVDEDWQIPGAQDSAFYRRVIERRLALRGARGTRP